MVGLRLIKLDWEITKRYDEEEVLKITIDYSRPEGPLI